MRQLFLTCLLFLFGVDTLDAAKLALVIGNNTYSNAPLSNAINDASLIKETLEKLDFKVTYRTNVSIHELKESINTFASSLHRNDVALVYYAGHGMQYKDENYLVPIGANVVKEGQIPEESVKLGYLIGALLETKLSIILVDACRNNPFKSFYRGNLRGLVRTKNRGNNYVVSYATEAGEIAKDGDSKNGPYALALAKYFQMPYPIETVLTKVRADVRKSTDNTQVPSYQAFFDGEFYFTEPNDKSNNITLNRPNSSHMENVTTIENLTWQDEEYTLTEAKAF